MRSKKRLTLIVLTIISMIACLIGAVACGGGAEDDAVNMYILPQNETLVKEDFTLPKAIGANGAVSVTWKSNNTNAIKIEDNGGAEYDAKVTLQEEVTPVTLTISAGKASKDFTVRVDGITVYTFLDNYSFPQEKTSVTKDFDLETSTTIAGHEATISWGVDSEYAEFLEVNGTKAHVKPDYDIVEVEIEATFSYNNTTATKAYSFSVSPEFEAMQKVNRMYSQADYPLEFSGYIVHAYEVSESYGNATMYVIGDTFDYGYYLYRAKINTADVDKYVEGAHVSFSGGTAKNYNGLWENNSDGTVVIDDSKPAINPRDHVYAMDTDLLAGVPSLLWRESTLVSLSGWQVTDKAKEKPTAADSTLFSLKQGSKTIAVRISKYVNRTEDQLKALLDVYDSVNDGDFVNVTGLLGYYNAFQIQPISASDIQKVDAAVTNTDGAKLKAAVDAVNTAVKGIGSLVTTQKTIDMPTEKEGVTISYELVPKGLTNPTVSISGGKFTVNPSDSEKNYDIQVTYTLGENTYYSFFKLRNWKKTPQEIVDIVAGYAKKARVGNITASGKKDFPEIDSLGTTITWSVKGEMPAWLTISGSAYTVSQLPEFESEIIFVATISLDGADPATVEFKASKVSARPNVNFTALTEAKEGTYKFAMLANGTMYYATGSMSGFYLATTNDSEKAADAVVTKASEGKYTITVGGKYLELVARTDGKEGINAVLNDEQTEGKYWQWNDDIKNFVMETTYNQGGQADATGTVLGYCGTNGTYTTMGGKLITEIATKNEDGTYTPNEKEGVSQWVAHIGTLVDGPKKTDQDLVDAAIEDVLDSYKITVAGDWLLPTCKVNGVKFTWAVKGTSNYTIVDGTKLAVNQLPDTAETVTLTLTASIDGKTVTATKDVTITIEKPVVVNYGSVDAPLTVAEAIALANTIGGNDYLGGKDDPIQVVVKGIVIDAGTFSTYSNWQNAYFADTADALKTDKTKAAQIYRLGLDGTFLKTKDDLKVGAEITIQGWLQNFNGTAEVCHNNATSTDCKAVAYKAPEGGEDPTPGPTLSDPVTGTEIAAEGATVFDFSGVTVAAENDYNAMANEAILAEFKGTAADLPTAVEGTKVYAGNNNSTSGPADYRSKGGFLRMGTGSAVGTLKLTFAKDINKVQILCIGWSATDKIAIDGFNPTEIGSNTTKVAFTFTLSEAVKTFTITTTNRALIFKIAVTFVDGGSQGGGDTETDQEKVNRALAAVKNTYEVSVTGDYQLPTSTVEGVTFAWEVKGQSQYNIVNDDKLDIQQLPTDADVTVTLTLTATCGEGTGTKTVTVTVKKAGAEPDPEIKLDHKGTADDPYSVKDALAATNALESGAYSEGVVYVTGYVATIKNKPSTQYPNWNQVVIVDEKGGDAANGFTIYKIYTNEETGLKLWEDLSVGSKITVKGYLYKYAKDTTVTPEMSDNGDTKIETVSYEDARTDAEKAQAAVDAVKFASTNLTDDIELPEPTVTGVTFAWVSGNNQVATVDSDTNKLNVTRGDSDQNVKLTLTATCGTETAEEEYDFVVKQKVTLVPGEQSITLDFTTNFSTYTDSDDWRTNKGYGVYGEHSLSFATLGATAVEGTVELNNASRQSSTITTMPTLAAKNSLTAYVTVHADGVSIQSLTFKLQEWTNKKKFSKIVIETSTNGSTWTEYGTAVGDGKSNTILISEHGTFTFTATDDSVTYVRLAIYATGSSNVQVGISSIEMTVKTLATAAAANVAPVAILPGKEF